MPNTPTPVRLALGARVRALRTARGLSQEELGIAADLARTQIGEIERGVLNTGIDNLAKLAAALSVDLGELLQGLPRQPASGADR